MLAAIGVVVLLLAALAVGAVWLTMPGTRQTASMPGLSGAVEVTYDADWVPRIHGRIGDSMPPRHWGFCTRATGCSRWS